MKPSWMKPSMYLTHHTHSSVMQYDTLGASGERRSGTVPVRTRRSDGHVTSAERSPDGRDRRETVETCKPLTGDLQLFRRSPDGLRLHMVIQIENYSNVLKIN
jgi:hypothetical protein